MRFKVAASLMVASMGIGAFATVATAAECGTAGRPPCTADRVKPKPVATERIGATQQGSKAEREPPKPATPPPAASARPGASHEPAADPRAAVDVKLSKIPDIIAPEPKGDAQRHPPAVETEAEVGIAPLSPADAARMHRHDARD